MEKRKNLTINRYIILCIIGIFIGTSILPCIRGGLATSISGNSSQAESESADPTLNPPDIAPPPFIPYPTEQLKTLELAGNSLVKYPFFEFVNAFNKDSPVLIAIDPRNIMGSDHTCNIYIVHDKNATEWTYDRTLTDIRGAPQTATFSGSTIQQNTFLLTGSTLLSADAGTDLGVGYDLICDFNENGVLDGGDYIDGLNDDWAGFYVVHDLTQLGPLATTAISYTVTGVTPPTMNHERTYYPTNIASMGKLPLVIISHGNGHEYYWYDYLQQHLASYGFVVMSHESNTEPGIEQASTSLLTHTDAFLSQLATIGGGVLNGHVDSHRMIWIGHSRGGEGVVRSVDRLIRGLYISSFFNVSDLVLVSSIAPTDFLGPGASSPHNVNYHFIYGSADGDVSGDPSNDIADAFHIYERATGTRYSTYVHGASHNDFNCCGFDDGTGPDLIGRIEAQKVAKAVYLALAKHFAEGNKPGMEYLWRQWERFKPIGVATTTTVVNEFKEATVDQFVIDDYQNQSDLHVSSSGGAVTYNVTNVYEGRLRDTDGTFTWNPNDPMNGMTRARSIDITRGVVFDWSPGSNYYYEYQIIPTQHDFTKYDHLSFRACQQTHHPQTIAELGDLNFTVTLRDTSGITSSINFAAYGGGIEEVYQRSGGWQNEFEGIKIRLSDFLHNGVNLNLASIAAVRFQFGSPFGSSRGRIGLDDIAVTAEPSLVTIDPNLSFVTLTNEAYPGLTTCPADDGNHSELYKYVRVTVKNALGKPLPALPSSDFTFTITSTPGTVYYGMLSCTFNAVDTMTNSNGEIRFTVRGDTSIVGNITIQVAVIGVPLNDVDTLPCKSFDLTVDGSVSLVDFSLFCQDYGKARYRSDFTWDGMVSLVDFSVFGQHYGHHS